MKETAGGGERERGHLLESFPQFQLFPTEFFLGEGKFYGRALLLGQVEKPFSKSMLNRKIVLRVTKSQSMKDKISFIWYHMIILWWGGVWGVVWLDGGNMYSVFRRAE